MRSLLGRLRNGAEPVSGMTRGELLELLANDRRRSVIEWLEGDSPTALGELADHVAFIEYGSGYGRSERKRVYVALYQTHLPILREHGIVVGPDEALEPGPNHGGALAALRAVEAHVAGAGGPA